MSRLVESDVRDLPDNLKEYDQRLRAICGTGLCGVAQNAAGTTRQAQGVRVAVIPVTAGLGVIGGFCSAVAEIVQFLGAQTSITKNTDVRGIWEAVDRKCDLFFLADDNTFTAVNLAGRRAAENNHATGRGFVAALDLAAKGIAGKDVLVLGAGPVGRASVAELLRRGAKVSVYDVLEEKAQTLASEYRVLRIAPDLQAALREIPFVLDATPAPDFLTQDMLREDTVISAPGVPLAVAPASRERLRCSLIHDVLEIGVATMLFDAIG